MPKEENWSKVTVWVNTNWQPTDPEAYPRYKIEQPDKQPEFFPDKEGLIEFLENLPT